MSTDAVKLARLFMQEVSGVDDPANELPGWMVMKAAKPSIQLGPDQDWDVGAADKRIRAATGAEDAPTPKYASCFLHKSGDGDKFGDYKFLVCDVVDGDIKVMPAALRAAEKRIEGSSLSEVEKASVSEKIEAFTTPPVEPSADEAHSILRKIKDLVFPGTSTTEGDFDMNADELKAAIDASLAPVVEQVEALSKAVSEATPEGAPAATEETPEAAPAVTLDDVTKAVEAGLEAALAPYNEILEKVLDRQEGVEKALAIGTRKSLDGQESNAGDEGTPSTPTVADAIAKAFRVPSTGRPVAAAATEQ